MTIFRTAWLCGFAGFCGVVLLVTTDPAESLINEQTRSIEHFVEENDIPSTSTDISSTEIVIEAERPQSQEVTLQKPHALTDKGIAIEDSIPNQELYLYGDNVLIEFAEVEGANLNEVRFGTECQVGDLTVVKVDRLKEKDLQGQTDYTLDTTQLFYEELMGNDDTVTCQTQVSFRYQMEEQKDLFVTEEQQLLVQYIPH